MTKEIRYLRAASVRYANFPRLSHEGPTLPALLYDYILRAGNSLEQYLAAIMTTIQQYSAQLPGFAFTYPLPFCI